MQFHFMVQVFKLKKRVRPCLDAKIRSLNHCFRLEILKFGSGSLNTDPDPTKPSYMQIWKENIVQNFLLSLNADPESKY
jgi:hypothetical protein